MISHLKPIILSAVVIAMSLPAAAQQTKLLTADKHNEYGLVYTLPITTLEIEAVATRTVKKAGPYYKYAKKYIGTTDVISEDSESWTLDEVDMARNAVPDTENQYLMQLKNGALTYICVDNDGMLLSINKETAPRPAVMLNEPSVTPENGDRVDIKEYLQYVNEDFIASQSSAKQAQMLAESLMEIREAKISLTRGTAETMPKDGRQLELMLASLAHQEKALTAAFVGTVSTETVTKRYTYVPDKEGKEILFRFSDFAGFVDADDLQGDAVYLHTEVVTEPEIPVDAKGKEKQLPKDAVIYNLPGTARITMYHIGDKLYEQEMQFAQFGTQFGLNPLLFSAKKERSYAVFDPLTGALHTIGELSGE